MLVLGGLNSVRTSFNASFGYLACGTGSTVPAESNTALVAESLRLTKSSSDSSVDKKVDMEFIMTSAQGNGVSFLEVGLFTASSGGTMGSRDIIAQIDKNNTFEIDFVVTATFENG